VIKKNLCFFAGFICGAKLREYRYEQVWISAKRWKQIPVGWFLDSLQQT